MAKQAEKLLQDVFGYKSFRLDQEKIIQNILNKQDSLVIMPTGGGKSLCYQIPALVFDGLTVVISPLISLMKDQVEQLADLNVAAVFLNSSLSTKEYQDNVKRVQSKEIKLLYLAPETLFLNKTQKLLEEVNIDCITIDEAHCISEWGHDFRPEYRRISELISKFPDAVTLALTATATERVRKDIVATLKFSENNQFVSSFDRENLYISVLPKYDAEEQAIDFLKQFPDQSGIVYCFSRKQVESLAERLEFEGFSVRPYHAGLTEKKRSENQELFIRDDVQIIVATIAFGMGINKPNVRFVLHYDLPKNIESYYQEIGRAGRDGLRADCCLLYSRSDMGKINYFIQQKDEKEQQIASKMLFSLIDYIETIDCRRKPLLAYFQEKYPKECGFCDNCLNEKAEEVDVTRNAQKVLSCIKRSNERFGVNHIVEILRAANTQKIKKFEHQKLSTYGIGKDYSKDYWIDLINKLIQKKIISKDLNYGAIKLNENSIKVLKGDLKATIPPISKMVYKTKVSIDDRNYDSELFERLRSKRKAIADSQSIPPYVVFSDKSLREMCIYYPNDSSEFKNIHGVGQSKVDKYGKEFLDIIRSYKKEKDIKDEEKPKKYVKSSKTKKRMIEVGERFNSGESLEDLMKSYNVKRHTIVSHLYDFINEGHELEHEIEIPVNLEYQKIHNAFEELGTSSLKSIYEKLDQEVSYDNLHLCRVIFLSALIKN